MRGLWRTLSQRDYDRIAEWVTDDCIYLDVPVGPTLAARGPVDIAKRLQVGFAGGVREPRRVYDASGDL
ncbi:hypothetical protein [Nocardioides sp.]|uniref:hypothetical protein n=1 Tax=Nocardioides sp. TaxID=35761 RepID=UPI002EDA1994